MAMARAIREKDEATGDHCMWVGWLAAEIGQQLGLSLTQAERLRTAGILHDLGKICVPKSILHKPGPLTERERRLVRRHADIGADIVAHHDHDPQVQQAVRYHHDWYDGRQGRSHQRGSHLPLYARILAVADAFQSMVEERPYRRPRSSGEALQELRRCCGTQFDPDVVDALAAILAAPTART